MVTLFPPRTLTQAPRAAPSLAFVALHSSLLARPPILFVSQSWLGLVGLLPPPLTSPLLLPAVALRCTFHFHFSPSILRLPSYLDRIRSSSSTTRDLPLQSTWLAAGFRFPPARRAVVRRDLDIVTTTSPKSPSPYFIHSGNHRSHDYPRRHFLHREPSILDI